MSLDKTWYTLDEVAEKFGLDKPLICKWIEEGLVRAEMRGTSIERINVDDVALKVQEMTGI